MGAARNEKGQFLSGAHWRPDQPFRHAAWLTREYVDLKRSAGDIAKQFGVTDSAIAFWLHKHGIPRRSAQEARALKPRSCPGASNGMYGRRGEQSPAWKGGVTPERQAVYSTVAWKDAVEIVQERDGEKCRRCGASPHVAARKRRFFHIHHITPFSVEETRTTPDNLVTLCTRCHGFVHSSSNIGGEFITQMGGR